MGSVTMRPDAINAVMREVGPKWQDDAAAIGTSAIQASAPKQTGFLATAIVAEKRMDGATPIVRFRSRAGYSMPVHQGRGPVTAKNAQALRFVIGGQQFFRKSVGPAKPNPYLFNGMRPFFKRVRWFRTQK